MLKIHQSKIDYYDDKISQLQIEGNDENNITSQFNEYKLQHLKRINYTGKFRLSNINNDILVEGYLINGQERGEWTYYWPNDEVEKFKWIESRTGAICNDGTISYSTGRGTCSHHGGVNYWTTEYRKIRIN